MWSELLSLLRQYEGTGLIFLLYLLALAYLLITEKEKEKRILLVYLPLAVLILFLNPLTGKLLSRFGETEIAYRMLWILPVTPSLCYAIIRITSPLKGLKQAATLAGFGLLFVLSGSLIYRSPYFHRAQNLYHVPPAVVEIQKMVYYPGREVMVAFPMELVPFVRQYTSTIWMPYGREVMMADFAGEAEVFSQIMNAETVDTELLARYADRFGCHYVVLPETKPMTEKLTDYDYEFFGRVPGYVLYRSLTADFFDPYNLP
ncbi:MAG: hypothetical protein IKS07_06475 [Lachnospiraceae bacterium]|nr:hypothetical protein [Lachnospiraceae bacterium]